MKAPWLMASLLLMSSPGFSVEVEVANSIGTYVRISTGPLELKLRVKLSPEERQRPQSFRDLKLQGTNGLTCWTRRVPLVGLDDSGTTTVVTSADLSAFGTWFVDAGLCDGSSTASIAPVLKDKTSTSLITLAAVPDNSHTSIPTTSPFAMGCYFAMRYNDSELTRATQLARQAGVAFSREELRWDLCEPRKGTWNWTKFDHGIKACVENNIGVLGLLDYWGAYHDGRTTMTAEAVEDYGSYVRTTVTRYRPGSEFWTSGNASPNTGIRNWEVWNEPATFWGRSATEFGRLTAAAYRAAHAADPYCRVFFSNAGDTFDNAAMDAMGFTAFDGVTPHFYCPPRSPWEAGLLKNLREQHVFLAERGVHKPLWISEMGWHSNASHNRQLEQARYLVQSFVLALASGYEKVFWYNFVCDTPDKDASEYGVLNRADLSPKIAYAAYAGMVHQLEGFDFVKPIELARNVSAFMFQRPADGEQVCAIWADKGSGSLQLSGEDRSRVRVADMFANITDFRGAAVPIDKSPVFIAGRDLPAIIKRASVQGIPQVEAALLPTAGSLQGQKPVQVSVESALDKPVTVSLSMKSELFKSTGTVLSIAPESSATGTMPIRLDQLRPDNLYPGELIASLNDGTTFSQNVELKQKVATYGHVKIDGDLSEWKDARPLYLRSAGQAVGITPWMDWNISAVYYFKWDESNLYFAARVRDNVHCQPQTGELIWEGDSWQIGLDCGGTTYLYGMALTANGVETASWDGNRSKVTGMRAAIRDAATTEPATSPGGPTAEHELVYECAFPQESIPKLRLAKGQSLGISVLLNDNDGGGRAGWMESTPGIGTGLHSNLFDVFELE